MSTTDTERTPAPLLPPEATLILPPIISSTTSMTKPMAPASRLILFIGTIAVLAFSITLVYTTVYQQDGYGWWSLPLIISGFLTGCGALAAESL